MLEGPKHIMDMLLEYNRMEYRNGKLVIEFNKSDNSTILYGLQDAQWGGIKDLSRRTSGFKRNKGDKRGKRAYLTSIGWKVILGMRTQRWQGQK